MATFLVAHGAWSAGWAWKKMRPLLRARGHEIFTPTHTGLGERGHLASPEIDLETHIADILGVLQFEDLKNVVLIGHSYGGMVATGVADRARARIAQLVYLDAHVPGDGESLFDLNPDRREAMSEAARKSGDGWKMPANPMPHDTPGEDQTRATLPRHYIYAQRCRPDDGFRKFYERARREGWGAYEIDASHNPHITAPDALAVLLDRIARGQA